MEYNSSSVISNSDIVVSFRHHALSTDEARIQLFLRRFNIMRRLSTRSVISRGFGKMQSSARCWEFKKTKRLQRKGSVLVWYLDLKNPEA